MRRRITAFAVVLAPAAGLRALAVLGYRPAMWFGDSSAYVKIALHPYPNRLRPDGYGFLLWALEPFHSFAVVAVVQHLMGLGIGIMMYALLRRRTSLPGWGAALATAPVLLDGYQIELEHLVMTDVPFMFLVMAAITVVLWRPRPTWRAAAASGLLLGAAELTRPVALPLLVVFAGYLIIGRIGWRPLAGLVAACAVPIVSYNAWFHARYGDLAVTGTSGVYLYARTTTFADCARIRPPPPEDRLCPPVPPAARPQGAPTVYIWTPDAPIRRMGGLEDKQTGYLAGRFARRAILAQPGDYLRTVGHGVLQTFAWGRTDYPSRYETSKYEFRTSGMAPLHRFRKVLDAYEHGDPSTRTYDPYARWIRSYQHVVYLRGTMLAGILLIGLAGLVAGRGRTAALALAWTSALVLLVVPPATVDFDYRYVLPVVPPACLAAALAVPVLRDALRDAARRTGTLKNVSSGDDGRDAAGTAARSRTPR